MPFYILYFLYENTTKNIRNPAKWSSHTVYVKYRCLLHIYAYIHDDEDFIYKIATLYDGGKASEPRVKGY